MPQPENEFCGNCKFFIEQARGNQQPGQGECHEDSARTASRGWRWPATAHQLWCGKWKAIGGAVYEPQYGVGSARVSNDAGYSMSGIGSWTLIDTPGMQAIAMLHWQLQSAGVLQIAYGFGSPTDEFLANFDGIVTVAAGSNNQEIKVCLGLNGVPVPDTTVRMFARQSDTATPIPVGGTRLINDQDVIGMYIQSSGSATIYDHHMTAESEGPYPAGMVVSLG